MFYRVGLRSCVVTAPELDVIDVDAHVTEPATLWLDRLPTRWHDRAPRMVRGDDGKDRWYVAGGEVMLTVGHTATAGWPAPFPAAPPTFEETPAAAHDPVARLALMDELGIAAQVLYPNVGGFGNQAFLAMDDDALRLACVQAYNDWITEWAATDPARLLPVTAVPFWDIDATVAEVERGAAMGHRAILFSGEPQRFGLPLLGDRHWDPLWRVSAETGNPISFHLGGGDFIPGHVRAGLGRRPLVPRAGRPADQRQPGAHRAPGTGLVGRRSVERGRRPRRPQHEPDRRGLLPRAPGRRGLA